MLFNEKTCFPGGGRVIEQKWFAGWFLWSSTSNSGSGKLTCSTRIKLALIQPKTADLAHFLKSFFYFFPNIFFPNKIIINFCSNFFAIDYVSILIFPFYCSIYRPFSSFICRYIFYNILATIYGIFLAFVLNIAERFMENLFEIFFVPFWWSFWDFQLLREN